MKRNLFLLVLSLMLLSFGLSNAATIFQVVPGTGFYDGNLKINPGAFSFQIQASNTDPRAGFSMPFVFYGTGGVTNVTWTDTSTWMDPAFVALWPTFSTTWAESWDGNLQNFVCDTSTPQVIGDLFNFTGVSTGAGWWTDGTMHNLITVSGTFPAAPDLNPVGTFCVSQGNSCNDIYDWLWDPPIPDFPTTCWTVQKQPNVAPVITNPIVSFPPVALGGQITYQFNATDVEQDAITFSIVSGPGTITPGGLYSYTPVCGDVGQSISVVICAGEVPNPCPNTSNITVGITVTDQPPVIAGDCGKTIPVAAVGGTGTANFTATDPNTGDTKAWSAVPTPVPVGTYSIVGGVLTFNPDDVADANMTFVFAVTVTDCAGMTSTCEVTFNVITSFPYTIEIAKLERVLQGHHAYVPVIKKTGSEDMYGFDFLIAYDQSVLTFAGAVAGGEFLIPGEYEWEYFTYRYGPDGNCGNGCPSGMVRVVGMADQNNGIHHPKGYKLPDGYTMFTLDFLVSNNRLYECQYVPIRFFWMDCGDNTIAYHPSTGVPYEIQTAVSMQVLELGGGDITNPNVGFPTFYGAQTSCFDNVPGKPLPIPFIIFHNGGIDIICADSIDKRGDINLNGLANEIGDAVVFTNYFIVGLTAFTVNAEGQIAATDVNADGAALTVSDLVYLIRVIVGDALPYAKLSPLAQTANFVANGSMISTDAELGAAFFVISGNAPVSLADGAAGMEIKSAFDGQNMRVLVYSFEKGHTATGNILNTTGSIVSVDAADYFGSTYKTGVLPTTFSIANYPNPFNPTTTISLSLPVASDWTVTIYNVAGQKVAGFSGHSEAGTANVTWDASKVASGIYFYKAEAGKMSATKKMVLMK